MFQMKILMHKKFKKSSKNSRFKRKKVIRFMRKNNLKK